jgi:hypothetical protein
MHNLVVILTLFPQHPLVLTAVGVKKKTFFPLLRGKSNKEKLQRRESYHKLG